VQQHGGGQGAAQGHLLNRAQGDDREKLNTSETWSVINLIWVPTYS
jgi:hypothetical protein